MNVTTLLFNLQSLGVRVSISDTGSLIIDAPLGAITTDIREALKQYKEDILKVLHEESKKTKEVASIELLYVFHERAAIMEIDGGMLKEEAERIAAQEAFNTPEKLYSYVEHHPTIKFLLQCGAEIVGMRLP